MSGANIASRDCVVTAVTFAATLGAAFKSAARTVAASTDICGERPAMPAAPLCILPVPMAAAMRATDADVAETLGDHASIALLP